MITLRTLHRTQKNQSVHFVRQAFQFRRWIATLSFTVVFFTTWSLELSAAIRHKLPEVYDDFQGLELALRLVQDGQVNWSKEVLRAEEHAGRVPRQGSALAHRVRGLLAEDSGDLTRAEAELSVALSLNNEDEVRVELARVQLDRGTPERAHLTLKQVAKPHLVIWATPEGTGLRLRSARGSGRHNELNADVARLAAELTNAKLVGGLRTSSGNSPNKKSQDAELRWMSPASLRELVGFALDLQLRQKAKEIAIAALKRMPTSPSSIRSTAATELAEQFRQAQAVGEAEQILEAALLLNDPGLQLAAQEDVLAQRAKLAFQKGEAFTAAEFYRKLSGISPVYAHPASELSRLANWSVQSQQFAVLIPSAKDRWRQQATLALAQGQVAQLAAMSESFDRLFLPNVSTEDETWLYAVAYARLQIGDWRRVGESSPRTWLSRIRRSDLIEKSTQLRQAVDDCRSAGSKTCLFEFKTQL